VIARVFPSRNAATPDDELAFVGDPPRDPPAFDEIHVSVTFSWELDEARRLRRVWSERFGIEAKLGGPATGDPGGEFVPGRYIKKGYVITSRGCPNRCWFCDVPKREGALRELPITNGWNVLDSNLLACSPNHIWRVFCMLGRQARRPEFTGGLEAKRIDHAIASELRSLKANRIYCAYDTPDDLEPLRAAGALLQSVGFTRSHHLACYVLCGWQQDTPDAADRRMREAWAAGFMPYAMRYRNPQDVWGAFQRRYARPAIARRVLSEGPACVPVKEAK